MRLVIGLGSGRCGTLSLAKLLNLQEGSSVTHEFCPLPWEFDEEIWTVMMGRLFSGKHPYNTEIIGDVGFYWINYIERLLDLQSTTKFICLKRDREETMDSYMVKSSGLNVHPTDNWFRLFPRYNLPAREAVGAMWDDYYKIAETIARKYPDKFMLIDMNDSLNNEQKQRTMMKFAGFDTPHIQLNIKLNVRNED